MDLMIKKRNGELVEFNPYKIANAIQSAMAETEEGVDNDLAMDIANDIEEEISDLGYYMGVEDVQDLVEEHLMMTNRKDVAKRYIIYREERSKNRMIAPIELEKANPFAETKLLSETFLKKYRKNPDPFPFELGKFVYYRTYSRPIPNENRREKWWETCRRVVEFNFDLQLKAMKRNGQTINNIVLEELKTEAENTFDMMYNLQLFPSGRTLWVGGEKTSYLYPLSNFNCSFVTIDNLTKFSEIFFVLMLGVGVGLSVERKYVNKLPKVNSKIEIVNKGYNPVPKSERNEHTELRMFGKDSIEIIIGDSKFGWSKAIDMYLEILTSKQYSDVQFVLFNYNNVRPSGERLKTFGGFASGHTAIQKMFEKIDDIFKKKRDRNKQVWQTIKPIDCLDIGTVIAENVVAGGSRRSAEIIFCDPDEHEVLEAKQNIYYQDENNNWVSNDELTHRMLSNNTILYEEKPTMAQLDAQFEKIRISGEPSFGNMAEMKRRRPDVQGGNPCFEILLRDQSVCNLTEINLMSFTDGKGGYDREGMLQAQKSSARMGYRMATIELELHNWNVNSKEDMLTGCSLTGVMDFLNATNLSDQEFTELLQDLRLVAQTEANAIADYLKMNRPKLVTTVKPSGTISQLPTVSSGVHFTHSPYYIRRVRVSANDPLAKAMIDSGFNWYPEVGQTVDNHGIKVFEFPVKAPEGKTKYDVSAIEQLELYKSFMENYVDHNASNTIHVRNHEWDGVKQWIYENWDSVVGVTFLSLDDSFYQLLPYESMTEEEYWEMEAQTPKFDPNILRKYENFAEEFEILDEECSTGACPIK